MVWPGNPWVISATKDESGSLCMVALNRPCRGESTSSPELLTRGPGDILSGYLLGCGTALASTH